MAGRLACDFCPQAEEGAAPARWRYPARSFAVAHLPGSGSRGDWAACDPCHALIEADDWEGLEERYYSRLRIPPELAPILGTVEARRQVSWGLRSSWRQFQQHRTGPAVPIGAGS